MSSSAITPSTNLANFATASQAGIVSTTAQTFGGKKTFDGGAAILGDTSGGTVATGLIGERFVANIVTMTPVINSWVVGGSLGTLTAGDWILYFRVRQLATSRSTQLTVLISVDTTVDGTGSIIDGQSWNTFAPASQGTASAGFQAPMQVIPYRIAVGSYPSGRALYPKIFAEGSGTSNVDVAGFGIRIA